LIFRRIEVKIKEPGAAGHGDRAKVAGEIRANYTCPRPENQATKNEEVSVADTPIPLPRLLVLPRREIKALRTNPPPDDLQVFLLQPGLEALTRAYETDAHLTMYDLAGEDSIPRLTKWPSGLKYLKDQGLAPMVHWCVLDVDTPEHKLWTETPPQWWIGQLSAIKNSPEAGKAGWYKTRGGYHLVWPLSPPLPPDDWERYVAALRARLRRDGIAINEECKDWTRLMRLPHVTREGVAQDLPLDFSVMGWLNLLQAPAPTLTLVPPAPTAAPEKPASLATMDDWSLVKVGAPLKKQLEGGFPFSNTPGKRIEKMGEQGRDTLILSAAGALLSSMDRPDPEVVVRLLLPSVLASRRDDPQQIGDEETLRDRVRTLAEKEREKRPPPPKPPSDPFDGLEQQVVASTLPLLISSRVGRGYYVLDDRTNGYVGPHSPDHVSKAVLDLCPSRGARAVGDKGAPREGKRIFHEDGAFADQIILRAGEDISRYDPKSRTLFEACASWAEYEPQESPEVGCWLELLGGDTTPALLDWLATVRKISRPTCVLYLQGPKGIGKSMLPEALALLWKSRAIVPYETLSANFDGQLAESLLVVADEGMQDRANGRGSPSAIFRTVVTGSRRTIKRKHLPDAVLEACFRLVVTSNDDEALNLREQLTTESIEAIAERILYVQAGPEAGEYLRSLGGREHTEDWVRGGALVRHVLWLEQTRKVVPGNRLLVEGTSETLMARVAGKVGMNRHIVAALCRYLDQYADRRVRTATDRVMGDLGPVYHPRIYVQDGDLWVNLEALHERWPLLHGGRDQVTRDALAQGLRSLSRGRKFRRKVEGKLEYVYQVDGAEILASASSLGLGDTDQIATLLSSSVPF